MRPSHLASMLSLLALSPAAAYAQPVSPSPDEADFARGRALRGEGRDEEALAVFRAMWERSRQPRALAQVALAEGALGRWVDAERHLVEALALPPDAWVTQHRAGGMRLDAVLADIRTHLGRLQVDCETPGAELVIDARVRARLPMREPLRVVTGSVTFTVRAEGYVSALRTVVVQAGITARESVTLASALSVGPAVPPPTPGRPPTPGPAVTPRDRSPLAAWVMLGVGAASLVAAGGLFGWNLSLQSGLNDSTALRTREPYAGWARYQWSADPMNLRDNASLCASAEDVDTADAAQARSLCSSLSTSASAALGLGIAGAALATGGAVWLILARRGSTDAPPRVTVAPTLVSSSPGASLHAVW